MDRIDVSLLHSAQLHLQMCSKTRSQAVARITDRTASQHLWVSRDVIGHVTIWYLMGHFLLWSFGTESLSPAVFEILHSDRIRVTSLTFQGHVMSSVTWPSDSPYTISYWWSFRTKLLSLTVSEIFNIECNTMFDMTLIRPLNKGQGHSFWYQSISYRWLPIGCQ